jgi:phage terminase small subunit
LPGDYGEIVTDELTDKQHLFVGHYLNCLNATEAAARAGYQGNRNVLAVTGHENLRNPKIRAEIDARMAALVMPADEVLFRLSDQASGSMADFMSLKGRGVGLDLKKAALADKLHLVKKYSKTKQGVSIELYDAHAAQALLAKIHGLTKEDGGILKYLDLSKLDQEQLQRMSDGEDPIAILLSKSTTESPSGAGAP